MTKAKKKFKLVLPLKRVSWIYYSLCLRKDQAKIQTLINSSNEINAITSAYVKRLRFQIRQINIGAQKIDNSNLANYVMIIAGFKVSNKFNKAYFFARHFYWPTLVLKLF